VKLAKLAIFQARAQATEPAIGMGGGIVDYRGLAGSVSAAVDALLALRLPAGGYVLLDVQNPAHHVALIYALALLGLRSASVGNAALVDRAGPRPDLFLTDRSDVDPAGLPTRRVDQRWFAFDPAMPIDYKRLLDLPGFPDPHDIVRYIYSSGTTGTPKCVALTTANLELRLLRVVGTAPSRERSGRILNMLGFSTILGTMLPLMAHISGGMFCASGRPAEAMQLVRLFSISDLFGSVAQVAGLLDHIGDDPPPSSLKFVTAAGSRISPHLLTAIQSRLCNGVRAGYGSTELGQVATSLSPRALAQDGAAGYIVPWVEVETVDDAGSAVARGTNGILRVRTDELAPYVDERGQLLPSADAEGWFYPGDIARIEADGLLVITGRAGDVINRGGMVVAPEEIEDVLKAVPGIRDAGVVPVPNAAGIDEIWAGVVATVPIDAAALIEALRRVLNEKVPDRVFLVDAIPRNENTKIMRFKLRETLLAQSLES